MLPKIRDSKFVTREGNKGVTTCVRTTNVPGQVEPRPCQTMPGGGGGGGVLPVLCGRVNC